MAKGIGLGEWNLGCRILDTLRRGLVSEALGSDSFTRSRPKNCNGVEGQSQVCSECKEPSKCSSNRVDKLLQLPRRQDLCIFGAVWILSRVTAYGYCTFISARTRAHANARLSMTFNGRSVCYIGISISSAHKVAPASSRDNLPKWLLRNLEDEKPCPSLSRLSVAFWVPAKLGLGNGIAELPDVRLGPV